ncbi:outer membrane lipid asymmetry maintenance protein MlaD [Megalodesulfovibrio gigas]|uniref:Putative mammalian cell entry domain-containing protein n=1 Tax=Megalodesulfovibrio gigas (strain ATCC 19364 / DSM 1382 / NCIMB 9332 / VKM B-1759) TaxID=1121448 RepID=T2GD95_MEGG1|nr:outer membrane lipid asymmetry maintenance protein MlaD [Megalodesulfovibrio gigas]AGW14076.1 putative mammalian cell entry domain-containing protein [Megalodesulfovibrio gigas DSM 1382 = ATCC 19364]
MEKYRKETLVGCFVLAGLLCVAYLTINLGRMEVMGGDGYTVRAKFASVAGLRTGADVEVAGVPIGRVAGIALEQETGAAVVSMRINPGVALAEDTIASVKTAGLIGDKYIKLSPGGGDETLTDGGVIAETESAVDLEELISKYIFGNV